MVYETSLVLCICGYAGMAWAQNCRRRCKRVDNVIGMYIGILFNDEHIEYT